MKKEIFCLFVFAFTVAGCGPKIPTSDDPVEIEKVFNASFDNVWNNSLGVIKTIGGTIITQDKSAGLVTCKFPARDSETQTYANIYIKRHPQNERTATIYVTPFTYSSYTAIKFPERNIRLEFQDISFRNDYFSDIGNAFFDGLTRKL